MQWLHLKSLIEQEYLRRSATNPKLGWSFLYTPASALENAKVVLVGLNPRGDGEIDPEPKWEPECVNAYVDQPWGPGDQLNTLQKQVVLLFEALGVTKNEVFAANFVPFISPSWTALADRNGALTLGRKIWTDLSAHTSARLFVCLGKSVGREVAKLLGAELKDKHLVEKWGRQTIDEYVAPCGRTVLGLPHLSRYQIFSSSRPSSAETVGRVARRVIGAPDC